MKYLCALTLAVGLSALISAAPPVPRPAKNFTFTGADGKPMSLSEYKGKVVLVQFLDTTCPHCQALSRLLTKLQGDYGRRGFQAVGIAFNEANAEMARDYVKNNGVGIPVGFAPHDDVIAYLGYSIMDRLTVPQVMIIDRRGQIRAQSAPLGTRELQDESYLRQTIESLLAPVQARAGASKTRPQ